MLNIMKYSFVIYIGVGMLKMMVLFRLKKFMLDMFIVWLCEVMKVRLCMIFIVVSVVISVLIFSLVIMKLLMLLMIVFVIRFLLMLRVMLLVVLMIMVYSMLVNVIVELIDRLKLCDVR